MDQLSCDAERIDFDNLLNQAICYLKISYPNESYLENGMVYRIRLYSAALYLQVSRMISAGMSLDYCLNKKSEVAIQGFSKRGFNGVRDFINPLTGSKRKTIGTPFPLTKSNGALDIKIDVDRERAQELKSLIDNAGVSSFYLGKKGLAYVSDIRI